MAAPSTREEFLDLVRKSGVVDDKVLDAYLEKPRTAGALPDEVGKLAGLLVRDGILTHFQAEQFLLGKWRRFTIGKYKVLERLGSGGMGSVYLCEHKFMRRRVAVKVLPTAKADESSALERFYREARAVAALDHPNIVRAYDIDQDEKLHFLVMEYIDGASLQEIVKRHGPLDIRRAAHYIRQTAEGLVHAHRSAKLVHRDIKPGNILVDRQGVIKILDMGLARFFEDEESCITAKYDENVLGTADYLAPEQAIDSHEVDIRADIYSLGATFYFCLTGCTPFEGGTVAQKLIWHQTRQPKPVRSLRPEVPEAMAAVIDKMMAKDPAQRYLDPAEVVDALAPWTQEPIDPPPEEEMPRLSPAAAGLRPAEPGSPTMEKPASGTPSGTARKWEAGAASPTPRTATPAPASPRPAPQAPAQAPQKPAGPQNTAAPVATPRPTRNASVNGQAAPASPRPGTPAPDRATESLSWESLSATTADADARADTAPQPPVKRVAGPAKVRRRQSSKQVRWLGLKTWQFAALVAAGSLLLVLAFWAIFSHGSPATDHPERAAQGPTTWFVTAQADQPNSFPTVREALAQAQKGDRIVVREDQLEEPLLLEDGRRGKDVTIEAGNPRQRVVWVCPANPKDGKFVAVSNLPGFRLRGFTFDGQGRVPDLMTLSGPCPGLVLEDLQLQGFRRNAVVFWNCVGKAEASVTLKGLRVTGIKDAETALTFNANPNFIPPVNQQLTVQDSRFVGPYTKAAIRIDSPVLQVDFRRNRFASAEVGIVYAKSTPRFQVQLTLDSNTFADIHKNVLLFQGLPLTDNDSRVVVQNNLFYRSAFLAQTGESKRLDDAWKVFQFNHNVRDPSCKEGNFPLRCQDIPFNLPTNPTNDATFLRYSRANPLARAGIDQKPVGAPPVD
jgi:eukaryotic-like serine/threonine-protein kinase